MLDPDMKKGLWTQAEMKVLRDSQKELGNKWSEIAKRIPGRNENSVKNRWYNQKTVSLFFICSYLCEFLIQSHYESNHLNVLLYYDICYCYNCRRTRRRSRRGVQTVVLPVAHSLDPSKLIRRRSPSNRS